MKIVKLPPKAAKTELRLSSLKVFDIPVSQLIDSAENPNVEDEATFDQLVEGIKQDGFDEPVIVVPIEHGVNAGKYVIASGHHRVKAAKVLKWAAVPCVIKQGWDEDKRKIELVRRNMLKGRIDPAKFTKLYNELTKKYDASVLKLQMGFTQEALFKQLYKNVEKNLNPAQKKKLAEAKERITSVDGLSSVLNDIFKEHGTDLDHGFMVFSFAGKTHHYVEADKQLTTMLEKLTGEIKDRGLLTSDVFKHLISKADLSGMRPSDKVKQRKAERESK